MTTNEESTLLHNLPTVVITGLILFAWFSFLTVLGTMIFGG